MILTNRAEEKNSHTYKASSLWRSRGAEGKEAEGVRASAALQLGMAHCHGTPDRLKDPALCPPRSVST
jgi:hypothetical protein